MIFLVFGLCFLFSFIFILQHIFLAWPSCIFNTLSRHNCFNWYLIFSSLWPFFLFGLRTLILLFPLALFFQVFFLNLLFPLNINSRNIMHKRLSSVVVKLAVDLSLVQAVKLQLHISFIIFSSQLAIKQILTLSSLPLDLLLGVEHGEFPVDNSTLMLVPHQQIEAFKLLYGRLSHPLLDWHSLIVLFQHLLSYNVANSVDDLEQIVDKFVMFLDPFHRANVSALPGSFDIQLHQFMQLYSLFPLWKRSITFFILNPCYFFEIILTLRLYIAF